MKELLIKIEENKLKEFNPNIDVALYKQVLELIKEGYLDRIGEVDSDTIQVLLTDKGKEYLRK